MQARRLGGSQELSGRFANRPYQMPAQLPCRNDMRLPWVDRLIRLIIG